MATEIDVELAIDEAPANGASTSDQIEAFVCQRFGDQPMSHRLTDEVAELMARLVEIEAELASALSAPVVDLGAIAAARRHRQELRSWLAKAEEAMTR